jgi:hypothetical protein
MADVLELDLTGRTIGIYRPQFEGERMLPARGLVKRVRRHRASGGAVVLLLLAECGGGDAREAFELCAALREFSDAGGIVVTCASQRIASSATLLFTIGDVALVCPGTVTLLHAAGGPGAAETTVQLVEMYGGRITASRADLEAWLGCGLPGSANPVAVLDAEQLVRAGFADAIVGSPEEARKLAAGFAAGVPPPPTERRRVLEERGDPPLAHWPTVPAGTHAHIKLLSFNKWGGGKQALADVPTYTVTIEAQGQPVAARRLAALEAASRWQAVALPMSGSNYVNGVAALDSGRLIIVGDADGAWTSDSAGRTWVARTIGTGTWLGVAAKGDGSKVLAVGNGVSAWSTDSGATWTASSGIGSGLWRRLACKDDGSVFVVLDAFNSPRNTCKRTTDGSTWTTPTLPASTVWRDVCWSEDLGLFVTVGDSGNVATSTDGTTWTARSLPGGATTGLVAVAWSPALRIFVALGGSGTTYYTSPDGIAWTALDLPVAFAPALGALAFGGYVFVSVGLSTSGTIAERVFISADGVNWKVVQPLTNATGGAREIVYIAGPTNNVRRFFFIGYPGGGAPLSDPASGLSDPYPVGVEP